MKNNDEVIYDDLVEYVIEDDNICFTYKDVKYSIKSSNVSLIFKRKSDEEIFVIDASEDEYESYVLLKNDNLRFDIEFDSFKHNHSENSIDFEYNLRGDEEVLRKVKIQLI